MQTVTITLSRSTPTYRLSVEGQSTRSQVLGERARIAREIHDVLAHSLGALGIQIEAALSVLADAGDIPAAITFLQHASHLADDGLSETRQAIQALRTDAPPLPGGLASLAGSHEQHYHSPVPLSVSGRPGPIRPDANVALVRAAREALTNAARHAPGTPVTMHLDYTPRQVTLTISNPVRFRALAASCGEDGSGSGYGLAGMGERLQLTGGKLTAGQADGQWIVRAQVPL
jgi:signal transduction histidine kinase